MEKLNINPEYENFEKDKDKNIILALENELHNMELRNPKRTESNSQKDIKYIVLKNFINDLNKTNNFNESFNKLSDVYKHAIIVRLKNQDSRMGGNISYEFIKLLSDSVYGNTLDEANQKMGEFEEKLQEENKDIYNAKKY